MNISTGAPPHGAAGSRQVFPKLGVVAFAAGGELAKVWTRYGYETPNPWLNYPRPNVTYFVGANRAQHAQGVRLCHVFETTYDGSTTKAEDLHVRPYSADQAGHRYRKELSMPVGFQGGLFDRGHLIAAEFGGGMEAINLVTMPRSVNRAHKASTAAKNGFEKIAELGERYRNPDHYLKGTMTGRGEFILPNYREFELAIRSLALRGWRLDFRVSLRVQPSTVDGRTDVLHGEIWIEDRRTAFVVDCDLG